MRLFRYFDGLKIQLAARIAKQFSHMVAPMISKKEVIPYIFSSSRSDVKCSIWQFLNSMYFLRCIIFYIHAHLFGLHERLVNFILVLRQIFLFGLNDKKKEFSQLC